MGKFILSGYLAFSAFPRVEITGAQCCQGLIVTPQIIQQRNIFYKQLIPLLYLAALSFKNIQPLLCRYSQLLAQLIQLEQNTHILR
ncbi:hypothetical protein D3C80_1969100 [compost metagenome]